MPSAGLLIAGSPGHHGLLPVADHESLDPRCRQTVKSDRGRGFLRAGRILISVDWQSSLHQILPAELVDLILPSDLLHELEERLSKHLRVMRGGGDDVG